MSERPAPYAVPGSDSKQWMDVRFDNGAHTGVRVLRGTTIIEVQRNGRKKLVDISECILLTGNATIIDK